MGAWDEVEGELGNAKEKQRKIARLWGDKPGKVSVLIKLHDWAGRAIYFYNLLTGERKHKEKPSEETWNRWKDRGTEIDHPSINIDDVAGWVKYGKNEAKRRKLAVED